MYLEIQDIADVIAGYTFRGAIQPNNNGDFFVIQAKDISKDDHIYETDSLTKVSLEQAPRNAILQENDILIVSRGMKSGSFRSAVFQCKDQNVVATSSLHIIRIKNEKVLPEFISLYLNSTEVQNAITLLISGSYIGALPRSRLEEMKVNIPPIPIQQLLVGLNGNIKEQNLLLEKKKKLNQSIINSFFTSLIK